MLRLNLGSGPHPLDDFINIDLFAPADVKDDAVTLKQFQPGSIDEIVASHVLEHFGKHAGARALRRWWQLLAIGGRITITVPDVGMSMRAWLDAYNNGGHVWEFRSRAIWGDQAHEGEYHKWGYDESSLRDAMLRAGFKGIKIRRENGHDPEQPGNVRTGWWIVAEAEK